MTSAVPQIIVISCFLFWRACRKSQQEADAAERELVDGPMISHCDEFLKKHTQTKAIDRAFSWVANQQHALMIHNIVKFSGQVGGLSSHKRPLLSFQPSYLLKPLREDHRGIREIAFYEAVKDAVEQTENITIRSKVRNKSFFLLEIIDKFAVWLALHLLKIPSVMDSERRILACQHVVQNQFEMFRRLHAFLPDYYGVLSLKHGQLLDKANPQSRTALSLENYYLVLKDATRDFSRPCTIDVKIGTQSFEPDATEEKQRREKEKYPPQTKFGFRIVGMRIFDPAHKDSCGDGFVSYSKHVGRSLLTRESVKNAFKTFFCRKERQPLGLSDPISSTLSQLARIQQWFHENDSFCFYASSLLIVYEGAAEGISDIDRSRATVKMIDFARVHRKDGGDEGCLLGIQTMSKLLQEILEESKQ